MTSSPSFPLPGAGIPKTSGDLRCLLVHPRFRSASFWNYGETCRAAGARYPAPPLGLITVAALLPRSWRVRLVDRNVQMLRQADWAWADIVLIGAMLPQQADAIELVREAKRRAKIVVVGGPDPTSSPHVYAEADHLVLHEAELTLPRFLADLERDAAAHMYVDDRYADITLSPCPRFDLLDLRKYLHVGVQWSRGCPFACEFCDIIELFGRVPRTKSPPQMLHELQSLHDLGYRGHVDFVDDNFIGNRSLAKAFLAHLEAWQQEHRWPFRFTTEASINLADDSVLLRLMRDTGFFALFVGIESPDEEALLAVRKRQNVHRSIVDSILKICGHGMFVNAGYIIGFDTERGSVARRLIEFVAATQIPVNMVGLLFALPRTQLARRLQEEGRLCQGFDRQHLADGDQCTAGLNFDTLRPRADILRDYLHVVEAIYDPKAYFGRAWSTVLALDASHLRYRPGWRQIARELRSLFGVALALTRRRTTRKHFWRLFLGTLARNRGAVHHAMAMAALYLHLGPFSRHVCERTRRAIGHELETAALRSRAASADRVASARSSCPPPQAIVGRNPSGVPR